MNTKNLYLALCVAGIALPCAQFLPWLGEHGLDLRLFVEQLFANRISAFFAMDVIVSSIVLWVFVIAEGQRVRHRWAPIVASLVVGVSLGLPLFLYLRTSKSVEDP